MEKLLLPVKMQKSMKDLNKKNLNKIKIIFLYEVSKEHKQEKAWIN